MVDSPRSLPLALARIDPATDRVLAARAGQLLSDSFLSSGVAYFIEPDISRLRARLPAHFVLLLNCIGETGGACAVARDGHGRDVGVISWVHPAAARAVPAAAAQQAGAKYRQAIIDLWGPKAANRYWAGCRAMEAVADAALGAIEERTISIKLCAVAAPLLNQGAGSAMLLRFVADPDIVRDATHLMASTETTRFWERIGMDQVGPAIEMPPDGTSPGFAWRMYKGRLDRVAERLRLLATTPAPPPRGR
jgi:hypothetical protein